MLLFRSSLENFTDQDGDTIMSNTPISPFKDKFNFDWFSFDEKVASPKSPEHSPISPSAPNRSPSVSTASPTNYFIDSPVTSETPSRDVLDHNQDTPLQVVYPDPPSKPLRWVWHCHLCHSRYPLAVTRRCLVDGHYYCSGNTQTQRNVKKRRKQQSCTSEFDYVAWKDWGLWRRKTLALRAFANGKAEPQLAGCDGCSSPSQCRYENRKPMETIKFEDFIEAGDLVLDEEQLTKSDTDGFEKGHKTRDRDLSTPTLQGPSRTTKKPITKKSLQIDPNLSSSLSQKSSKRYRFYSSLAGSLSNRGLSPTSESLRSLDRGRFDTMLPSVTQSNTRTDDNDELMAVESSLKAALTGTKQPPPSARSQEAPTKSQTASRRRVNSKMHDPEFEITSDDVNAQLSSADTVPGLQRTASQQSLLTDFFRQTKGTTISNPTKKDPFQRAMSEADIAEFLQLKSAIDPVPEKHDSRRNRSVQENNGRNFEDIYLSPTESARFDGFSSDIQSESDIHDSVKNGVQAEAPQPYNGNDSGRLNLAFGFPSFIFGRK